MISKTIQNETIEGRSHSIRSLTAANVCKSKLYTKFDGTTDINTQEHMLLCIRCIDLLGNFIL